MSDLADIKAVKYRYLRALDTKKWDEFATTLTEDIAGDYGSSLGEKHQFTDRDSLVGFMRNSLPTNVISEHRVTHPEITIDGDEASGIWYLQDRVIVADFDFMLIGAAFYHDRYRRTPTVGRSAPPDTSGPTRRRCRSRGWISSSRLVRRWISDGREPRH